MRPIRVTIEEDTRYIQRSRFLRFVATVGGVSSALAVACLSAAAVLVAAFVLWEFLPF